MTCLEAAGAYYGPEGRFGRANVISNSSTGGGWSNLPWPIQGGSALIKSSRLSTSSLGGSALFTNDLLLTGHEDGSVGFWRLSAGGALRRIYTLHTSVLFDGDVSGFVSSSWSLISKLCRMFLIFNTLNFYKRYTVLIIFIRISKRLSKLKIVTLKCED